MPADPANVRTAIVLQGGGALGAYELGVLEAIYDQRPGFTPAAVSGISIGAVTAAVLGGGCGAAIAPPGRLWGGQVDLTPRGPGFSAAPLPVPPPPVHRRPPLLA